VHNPPEKFRDVFIVAILPSCTFAEAALIAAFTCLRFRCRRSSNFAIAQFFEN
jgi:hypothetical protein